MHGSNKSLVLSSITSLTNNEKSLIRQWLLNLFKYYFDEQNISRNVLNSSIYISCRDLIINSCSPASQKPSSFCCRDDLHFQQNFSSNLKFEKSYGSNLDPYADCF